MITRDIPYNEIAISYEELLSEIGYGSVQPDDYVSALIQKALDECEHRTNASYCYHIVEGVLTKDEIIAQAHQINANSTITGLLGGSTHFAFFIATAGIMFQQWIEEVKATEDSLMIFIVDSMGSLLAEKAGDYMERQLEKEITPLQHTNRFSPGYCGWHLTDQRNLFSLLKGHNTGVILNDVCLMIPIKSISGVMGIGEVVNQKEYGCQHCELEFCYKRNMIARRVPS